MKKDIKYFYKVAKDKKIKINNFKDDKFKLNGLCIYDEKTCDIFINDCITNPVEEKCVLAEEIGHYTTGIIPNLLNTNNENMVIRSINEFRAKKWAINEIIPFNIFKSYFGTNKSKFEVANELEVTEEMIDMAYFIYEPYLYN